MERHVHDHPRNVSRRQFLAGTGAIAFTGTIGWAGTRGPTDARECERTVRLADGRCIAFAEYGNPKGTKTVFYHHGLPTCRLAGEVFRDALAARPEIRLLAIDRPGIGLSTPAPDTGFLDWPVRLATVADAMKIDQFGVIGESAGTPYTLAVARAMPERVTSVTICCPVAPFEVFGKAGGKAMGAFQFARHPAITGAVLKHTAAKSQRGGLPVPQSYMAEADRVLLADPANRAVAARWIAGAIECGPEGAVRALIDMTSPWNHWLGDVRKHVVVVNGCSDLMALPMMARYLATALPDAELRSYQGEGHLSLVTKKAVDILAVAVR